MSNGNSTAQVPLVPSDLSSQPVADQPSIIPTKSPERQSPIPTSKSISKNDIEAAEKLAEVDKREPLPASFVGWKQMGEWEEKDALTQEDELIDLATPTLLDSYLPDNLYGDWYHSVGIVIGSALLSWIMGWLGLSLAPVFFIMLFSSIYYRTSIKKYRSTIRDEIQKEFTIKHIEDDYETMDWLNTLMDKLWVHLEPSVSQMVTEQGNPILASNESIPAFIKAIWIDKFTVGRKPPRIDFVKTLQIPKDDVVVMDWGFSFTPHDLADLSAKQLKNYVNQKIVIKANLFGMTIPFKVENFALRSFARIRMKMTTAFPHVETINVSLVEPPQFDFTSKIFGDSIFNWEFLAIPGLLNFINEMTLKFVGPMLFQPFSFQLNVPQLLNGAKTSVGILSLTIKSAKDLKAADRVLGNTVDPYLTFSFNGRDEIAKTKTIMDTFTPKWNETLYLLVGSFTEPLIITIYDYNDDRKDKKLGQLQIDLKEKAKNQTGVFLRNTKPVGELKFDYEFSPTLETVQLVDGSSEPPKDLNTGLTKIELREMRNIKTLDGKALSQYVEIYFNNELIQKTDVIKDNNNPTFASPFETIVMDRRKAKVKILVKDPKGKLISASIQPLNNLIDSSEINKEWIPFAKGEGEFKISTIWRSVELSGVPGTGGYTEPIGVVRVLLNKASNVRNLEAVGKVDPYARVLVNKQMKGRTNLVESTLDPVWNEVIYVPVCSANQKLTIEAMDAERNHHDRSLGSFDVKTSEIIEKSEDGHKYIEHVDDEMRTGKLIHKKGPKGAVTYALSFYPTMPVKSLEDVQEELLRKKKKEEEKLKAKNSQDSHDSKKEEIDENEDFEGSNKIELPFDELVTYPTGVFAFTIITGEFTHKNTFLQVFFDDHGFPDCSIPINEKNLTVPYTGDCLIKELDWSTATFRLVKKEHSTRVDEAIAEVTIPTLALLRNTFAKASILTLKDLSERKSSLKIQSHWIPVLVSRLPQSDRITNSGSLDIDIISASGLISADSNGKSDPFVKVYLNDEEDSFFKTKTIKKTLDPVWNEKTTSEIYNRVNTTLRFKVLDWDFGAAQDDKLGEALLDLSEIDPVNPREYILKIDPPSSMKHLSGGELKIKLSFRARYITRVNEQKTNLGDVGLKTVATGIGAGIGATKTFVNSGAGVVGKMKRGIFGGKKDDAKDDDV